MTSPGSTQPPEQLTAPIEPPLTAFDASAGRDVHSSRWPVDPDSRGPRIAASWTSALSRLTRVKSTCAGHPPLGPSGLRNTTEDTVTGIADYRSIPSTTLADILGRAQVMDIGVRALWGPHARVAGPAYTVRCPRGDNLMLHAAIYRAAPGSVVVVESGDLDYTLAGGNVCAVAQRHGIAAFVLDGLIRDVAEVRHAGFPVFGRGVIPISGTKSEIGALQVAVYCAGVRVAPGDIVVADEDGVVVTPRDRAEEVLVAAVAKLAKESTETLDDWEQSHRARIDKALRAGGFSN